MTFQPFGPDHWSILAVTLAAGFGLAFNAGRIRRAGDDRFTRCGLAFVLIVNELASWVFHWRRGTLTAPFHLCDLALFVLIWSLLAKNKLAVELAFFWGLGASSQAILTPDIQDPFPSFQWMSFFLGHCGIVLGVIYLLARGYTKVTINSVWRAWLFTNLYVLAAGFVNWGFGTNFGYLARKPENPSLLDYLGPWPYYILWGELIALGLFFLCYLFARKLEKRASRVL